MNTAILSNVVWQLKILTVIIGFVDVGVTSARYVYSLGGAKSEFFLAIVIVCFMISFVWVVFAFMNALQETDGLTNLDFFYHAIGGILLLIGGICWFVTTGERGKRFAQSKYIQMVMAGIFGFFNGFLYLFVAFRLYRARSTPQASFP